MSGQGTSYGTIIILSLIHISNYNYISPELLVSFLRYAYSRTDVFQKLYNACLLYTSCGGETYECDNLLLCTGSETFVPAIPGIDKVPYWTHRDTLDNKELPCLLYTSWQFILSASIRWQKVQSTEWIFAGSCPRPLVSFSLQTPTAMLPSVSAWMRWTI